MMQNSITMGAYGRISDIVGKMQNGTQLTTEEQGQYNIMAMANQQISTQKRLQKLKWQKCSNKFKINMNQCEEAMLEPLKDEIRVITRQKRPLESQIQIAQADYEA